MNVQFIATTKSRLPQVPITNGQLIYLDGEDIAYYDLGSTRHSLSSVRLVASLPSTGQEGIIYVLADGSNPISLYLWDSSLSTPAYVCISGYVATATKVGQVKPDGVTTSVDANGTLSVDALDASSVSYDNSTSGLTGDDAQSALDEIVSKGVTHTANTAVGSSTTPVFVSSTGSAEAISGPIPLSLGGTGAATAAAARTSLGLGSAATHSTTSNVTSGSQALITSGGVYTALDSILTRLSALEAVADIALTVEENNIEE